MVVMTMVMGPKDWEIKKETSPSNGQQLVDVSHEVKICLLSELRNEMAGKDERLQRHNNV
jgi:hypothetical protein